MIKGAEAEGATLLLGGTSKGSVLEPTVLADVKPDQHIVQQELFGPVAVIMKAQDEQEAVRLANDTPYGLSGSVFTGNLERGYQVAQQIESGMVHVNDQSVNDEAHVMFGGEKSSGLAVSVAIGLLRSSRGLAGSAFSINIGTTQESNSSTVHVSMELFIFNI